MLRIKSADGWLDHKLKYGAAPGSLLARGSGTRPNILFLLVDDQRNDTLGCAGHPIIKTPMIDSLAAAGVMNSGIATGWPNKK